MMWGVRRPVPVGLNVDYRQENPDGVPNDRDRPETYENLNRTALAPRNRQFSTPSRCWGSKYGRIPS